MSIDISAARTDADTLRPSFTPEQLKALEAFCMKHTYTEGMRALFGRPSKAEAREQRQSRRNGPVTVISPTPDAEAVAA